MKIKRTVRLNSLLKEVISEVIKMDVNDPDVSILTTVTGVDITSDLHQAKVYISIIGDDAEKEKTMNALKKSAGYIGKKASKKVVMRYFPTLTFILDSSVDKHMQIEKVLDEIHKKEQSKENNS